MRIIVMCIHYPVASGRYISDAFKRLGHDVRTLGDSTGNYIWGMSVDPKYTWQSNGDITTHWQGWKPDLIVIAESAWAYHHPVYQDVPHIIWGVDNHVRSYVQAGITRYFLAHKTISLQTFDDKTEWLPCAYDPVWFTPSPIPFEQRRWDVCCIGVLYPRRQKLIDNLRKAGLKVLAGQGWLFEEYRNAYHNSRISLCVSAASDVAQRIFETGAMGCAVLTDPLGDLLDPEANKQLNLNGFFVYDTDDLCVDIAKELIYEDMGKAELGAMQMQKSCKADTWDARGQYILDWYNHTYPKSDPVQEELSRTLALSKLKIDTPDEPKRKRKVVQ